MASTAQLSLAGATLALNRVLRNTGTSPTSLYLGLATVAIASDDALTDITEVTTGGYARQAVSFDAPAGDPPICDSSADVTFDFSADPPAIQYLFLTNAASGTVGTIYARWSADAAIDATTDESITVKAGNLQLQLPTAESELV